MRLLVADHDSDFADITAYALRRHGYDVRVFTPDGVTALRAWKTGNFDAALLDARLERMGGAEVCRRIKRQSQVPVIVTGDSRLDDVVAEVFDSGADDYLVKPYSYKELEARLRAVIRRMSGDAAVVRPRQLRQGNLTLDLEFRRASIDGREVCLTRAQANLLFELLKEAGRPVSFERLAGAVWGLADRTSDASRLRIHACNLRRKLCLGCSGAPSLGVVPRTGYVLTLDPEGSGQAAPVALHQNLKPKETARLRLSVAAHAS
jgi:DNA-binding response OmpR family regulator